MDDPDQDLIEKVAQEIYVAMAWAYNDGSGNHAPLWPYPSNSHAQTEARRAARASIFHMRQKELSKDGV